MTVSRSAAHSADPEGSAAAAGEGEPWLDRLFRTTEARSSTRCCFLLHVRPGGGDKQLLEQYFLLP